MRCKEAIFVDKSTINFPIFLLIFNTKFPIFPIFSILNFLFSYFFEQPCHWTTCTGNRMTCRASLKLFLCNVLFSDNIFVLKVYSKSFVYNAFNDFAGYCPYPLLICSVKKEIAKHSINEDQSTEETGKMGATVQCIRLYHRLFFQ